MQEENIAEEIELELEVPEEEVDTREADVDANAADQLSLVPETEVTEDKTPEDRVKDYLDSDPELQEYGNGVQKRINKLTYQREEAKRREEAAVQYAQQVQAQLQMVQNQTQQINIEREEQLIGEYGNRINAELETAKQRYKDAYESGDADLIVEANKELSALSAEQDRIKRRPARPAQAQAPAPASAVDPQVTQNFYNQPSQVPQPPAPDEKAEGWATENTWFGEDEAMTHSALGYHRKIVEEEGVDPHSDTYYERIDSYMRTNFPHKFDNAANSGNVNNNSPVQTVASAGRSVGGKTGRKVKLTASQVAIAKRLNVPLTEYAKYV